ncbi:MAG: trypsin-like peptidase domain-containing protein [Clostridia bacterium]|nr:trypsin-like peptidase domain-containing protein [Clostridia bacterium]
MDNENNFEFASQNSFKKSSIKHTSGGFGKSVFVPFISGILGASLVMGVCFGIPTIKQNLLSGSTSFLKETSSSTYDNTDNQIDITDYSNTSIAVAEKSLPSVVGIKVTYQISSIFGSSTGEATGSGIIISEDGYIVTNNHVVASESSSYYAIQEATGISIKLYNDDKTYEAKIIGTDEYTDLAVLKIEKTGLTPATIGDSSKVKVGEFVMAVGNPLGMDYSVTTGVVSAIEREVQSDGNVYSAIQTDAAINSGNSGGALVNSAGEVIGINTLKLAGTGIEGVGFAIPISSTTSIISQLIENKTVVRPYIGITGSAIDEYDAQRYNLPQGVYVESVGEDSPASKAGLQKADIITKIEGKEVTTVDQLNRIKYNYNVGDKVKLTVIRGTEELEVEVTLVATPQETTNTQTQPTPQPQTQQGGSIFDFFR